MSIPLKAWINHATPKARNIVRQVLANSGRVGLTTQEIFDLAIKQFPDEIAPAPPSHKLVVKKGRMPQAIPEPPFREHPIRSVRYVCMKQRLLPPITYIRSDRYLKKLVLEDLTARGEVVKAHVRCGAAGKDKNGQKWDVIAAKGFGKAQAVTDIPAGEGWMWVLTSQLPGLVRRGDESTEDTARSAPVIQPPSPDQVKLEVDDDDFGEREFKEEGGWEHMKFVFKDVSPLTLEAKAKELEKS